MNLYKLKKMFESTDFDLCDFLTNHIKLNINNQIQIKELLNNKDFVYEGTLYRVVALSKDEVFMGRNLLSLKDLLANVLSALRKDVRYCSWSKSLLGIQSFQSRMNLEGLVTVVLKAEGHGVDVNKLIDITQIKSLDKYKKDEEVLAHIENSSIVYINGYDVNKIKTAIDKDKFNRVKFGSEYVRESKFTPLMNSIRAEERKGLYYLRISENTELQFEQVSEELMEVLLISSDSSLDGLYWDIQITEESLNQFLIYIKEEEQNQ